MTNNLWLRRYWKVYPTDPRPRWCLPCGEWFVGRDDCPICHQALVIEDIPPDPATRGIMADEASSVSAGQWDTDVCPT